MSYTQTPNYSLFKPTINADNDQWGTHLNTNADTLDTQLKNVSNTVPAPSSTTPAMDGVGQIGTGTTYARADHVHPANTAAAAANVGRNLIHNPLFNVAQRGAGPWTVTGYTLDRWQAIVTLDTVSIQQSAVSIPGDESVYFCLVNAFTGNAGASAYNWVRQPIENVRRLAGKTVTISFWAWTGSGALKLGVGIDQYFGSGGAPSATVSGIGATSVTLSTTPTRYSTTIAIPSIVAKTLGSNNDHATYLDLWFSSGATNNAIAGNIGVQSGTIAFTGVQLEIGSVATPLEKPDPQQDLAKCQRFYCASPDYVRTVSYAATGASWTTLVTFPVPMRAAPTIVLSGQAYSNASGAVLYGSSLAYMAVRTFAAAAGDAGVAFNYTASADL